MFDQKFKNKLKLQRKDGLYRNPPQINHRDNKNLIINNQKVLNFASNDYLGLGFSSELRQKVSDNFLKYGSSSSSSRLVSGNYLIISQAEKKYANFFGYEDALFYPSGYQANLGILSTFFENKDTIFFDKHLHASSVKGMLLSNAEFMGYKHKSITHLSKRLDKYKHKQCAVVTESLFSMDGDLLPVEDFIKIKNKYKFLCIVDEAHSFGVLGKNGTGIAQKLADISVGTFGKALGLFGAFVLLPKNFKEYLINFSSPLIYSTSLPQAHAASAIDILEFISSYNDQRKYLSQLSQFMREELIKKGFEISGDAHIIAIKIGNADKALELSQKLISKGFYVLAARFPTVPINQAILRISITSMHNEDDIKKFVKTLSLL